MRAIALGVAATLLMDAWNLFLMRGFGIASLDYCLLGRWVRHMPLGILRHADIRASAPLPRECTIGWLTHYAIGIALAVFFVRLAPGDWMQRPTPLAPLAFGVVTVAFPLFILQPALGFGIAASRTPDPLRSRIKSLVTHLVFGAGLYLSAQALNGAYSLTNH